MGKYDKIVGKLKPAPPDLSEYQQSINALKDSIRAIETHTPESLARAYMFSRIGTGPALKDAQREKLIVMLGKEGIEALLYDAQKRVTALEQMIVESHDHAERGWGEYGAKPNAVRMQSGGSISVQPDIHAKVEDKERFRLWCVENGLEKSLQLWPSTMTAMTKERLIAGHPEPDGVIATPFYKVVLRLGGKADGDD